jgi:hypothetical protein
MRKRHEGQNTMGFSAVVFLCIIILTATHVLDGVLKRCCIKKSTLLLCIGVFFAVSILPAYNLNRYFSLHLLFALSVAFFGAQFANCKYSGDVLKQILLLFFVLFIYIVEMVLSLINSTHLYYYAQVTAIAVFCAINYKKPQHAFICAYFGVWFLRFVLIVKNIIMDAYFYFDLSDAEVMQFALLCALCAFSVSYIVMLAKNRRKRGVSKPVKTVFTLEKK